MGENVRSLHGADANTTLRRLLLRPLLSLFSALILCGLLMLSAFTSAGTIEVEGCMRSLALSRLNEPLIELTAAIHATAGGCGGRACFELMDRPRQRYGGDDRPLQSGAIDIDHLSLCLPRR